MIDHIASKGDYFPRTPSVVKLVGGVVNFCDPLTFKRALKLLPLLSHYHVAVGVHPKKVPDLNESSFQKLECLLACPRVAAISELGIDHTVPSADLIPPQWNFVRRLLSRGCRNQVLVLHLRPAGRDPCGHHLHGPFRDLLRQFCGEHQHIHLHNFSGDLPELQEWMAAFKNVYAGVSGLALQFNPAQVHMIRSIPSTRLLLETDSPYLPVIPGLPINTPYLLEDVGRLVSRIRDEDFREVMRVTAHNAQVLYSGFAGLTVA
nr:putative deoxyribonuclease TATDN2 [Lytechinus pictus]